MFSVLKPKHWLLLALLLHAIFEFNPFHFTALLASLGFVSVLCIGYLLISPNSKIVGDYNIKPVLFLVILLAYNLLSYSWAIDRTAVISYNWSIIRYLLLFLIYSNVMRDDRIRQKAHWFLFGLFTIYLLWSLVEIGTMQHIPNSRLYNVVNFIPTGAFVSENMLAAYMMILVPFIVYSPKFLNSKVIGPLSFIMTILVVVVITVQGARIGLMGVGAFLIYYFLFQVKPRSKLAVLVVLAIFTFGIFIVFKQPAKIFMTILRREASTIGSEAESMHMSSVQIRKQLITESIEICAESGFIGVGGGNFEHMMHAGRKARTGWITNAHNYFMEILGNWGLLIFLAYVFLFVEWYYRLFFRFQNSSGQDRLRYAMFLCSMLLFVPATILPSSIRHDGLVWIYLAVINAVAYEKLPITERIS